MLKRQISIALLIIGLLGVGVAATGSFEVSSPPGNGRDATAEAPPGMVWVPAGEFTMGWDGPDGRPDERPAHRVYVDGFWIDATEVTNAQFRAFVEATGYVTTAERAVDWEELRKQVPEGTPKPSDQVLAPGSLVFTPPSHAVDTRDYTQWWSWTQTSRTSSSSGATTSASGTSAPTPRHDGLPDAQHRPHRPRGHPSPTTTASSPAPPAARRSSPARACSAPGSPRSACPAPKEGMHEDPTIAGLLKAQGYATGQFGKNHLGDRDEHLPTNHGFDEFFGNLYHLNAEEEPENEDYPGRHGAAQRQDVPRKVRPARRDPLLGHARTAPRRSRTPAR
jgi:hypothetical protein